MELLSLAWLRFAYIANQTALLGKSLNRSIADRPACLLLTFGSMERLLEIPTIGRKLQPGEDFAEDQATIVDEPVMLRQRKNSAPAQEPYLLTVRKLEAAPADEREELESARHQLHATVDRLIDRALDSVGALRALVDQTQKRQEQLNDELDFVVQHANALVREQARPRRRDDTLVEFPTVRNQRAVA